MLGPVFARELVTTPRRPQHHLYRTVYVLGLLVLMATAWLLVNGTQNVRNVGDMAHFGALLFQLLAPLQLALTTFLAAMLAASSVSQEKDRRTLILLLLTELSNTELVLGKLAASLLNVASMLVAAAPLLATLTLLGGVSFSQVAQVLGVTGLTALAAGSLGSTLALWREKTFQTLAMTALGIVLWIGVWEAVRAGLVFDSAMGRSCVEWAGMFSPLRALEAAMRPTALSDGDSAPSVAFVYMGMAAVGATLLNLVAIARIRVWNPSRELHAGQAAQGETLPDASGGTSGDAAEQARAAHVDARGRDARGRDARGRDARGRESRRVWDNPILWRELCTWAYGRKVLVIRLAYLLFFVMAAAALHRTFGEGASAAGSNRLTSPAAQTLAPFILISLVIVNALAVTSITNERDAGALDLLLVTDLTPREFVFGKLGGVLGVTTPMVVLPMLLCGYLGWHGAVTLENLAYLIGGLSVMNLFSAMLGLHCGMTYANSRTAIGVSLGTLFFLCLGVATCMLLMISFSGSFQTQLIPFSLVILGGAAGLYVAIGARNPSPAIAVASLLLPLVTFHAITSFALQHYLTVFFVTTVAYGFTTAAMLIPALAEFDFALGRTKSAGEE